MKQPSNKYQQLQKELATYRNLMLQAKNTIINEGVSQYPIMIIHNQELSVGIPIAQKGKVKGNWSVNASTLEEFMSKQLIEMNKVDSFKTIYQSRKKFICMFVLSELGADFIFLPEDSKLDNSNK